MSEVFAAFVLGKNNGYIFGPKVVTPLIFDAFFNVLSTRKDPEYRSVFSSHVTLLVNDASQSRTIFKPTSLTASSVSRE